MEKSIVTGIMVLALAPVSANAIVISTSVGTYDVTTIVGSFSDLSDTHDDQVSWGNNGLAYESTGLVADAFGFPNSALFFIGTSVP